MFRGDFVSFVSVSPLWDTVSYWWKQLDGEPYRLSFMSKKLVEISAFLDNLLFYREPPEDADDELFCEYRGPLSLGASPSVVVIVPVYCRDQDDLHKFNRLMKALAEQSYPCQVIAVDDCSEVEVNTCRGHVIRLDENKGPAYARNLAIKMALELEVDLIATTDADCLPSPNWIESIVDGFRRNPTAHLLSGTTMSYDRNPLGTYHDINGTLNGRLLSGRQGLLYGPTCNLAFYADVARCLSFDDEFPIAAAEDIDFCFRANKAGWRIAHCPQAIVQHDFGYTQNWQIFNYLRFWKQFRRYAMGERLLLKKHPDYYIAFDGSFEISSNQSW